MLPAGRRATGGSALPWLFEHSSRLRPCVNFGFGVRVAASSVFFIPRVAYGRVLHQHYDADDAMVEWTLDVGYSYLLL